MRLNIKIFTEESTEKYFTKLSSRASSEVRTGHMSKKMIEKYENDIKGTK